MIHVLHKDVNQTETTTVYVSTSDRLTTISTTVSGTNVNFSQTLFGSLDNINYIKIGKIILSNAGAHVVSLRNDFNHFRSVMTVTGTNIIVNSVLNK